MRYLTIYDKSKVYFYPNMKTASYEDVANEYSVVAVQDMVCIIETDVSGTMFYTAPEPLVVAKGRHGINQSLSDVDAVKAIEEILNAPLPEADPTAEERIAAAMEYQNLLSM